MKIFILKTIFQNVTQALLRNEYDLGFIWITLWTPQKRQNLEENPNHSFWIVWEKENLFWQRVPKNIKHIKQKPV